MPNITTSVLMSSTSYPKDLKDWKGLFIRHLSDALARREDVKLHLWAPPGEMHPAVVPATTQRDAVFLNALMNEGGIAHLLRSHPIKAVTAAPLLMKKLRSAYLRGEQLDIYHVNWLQNALTIPANGKPLIVSVLGTDMQLLKLPFMKSLLRNVLKQHPCIICPNADWMARPLEDAFGDVSSIRPVAFGIDPMWYKVKRSLPLTERHWVAVTRMTKAKLGPLFEWGAPLFEGRNDRKLHLFGPMQEDIPIPNWAHYHGPASPEALCGKWFPMAAGLITLSEHAEGRPQVMLEAMAAGLPIVASNLPAHENIINHGQTGDICTSPNQLAQSVLFYEHSDKNYLAGQKSRNWALNEIGTWDDCASRYCYLYMQLISGKHNA